MTFRITGYGLSHGHHGEIIQGAIQTASHACRPILITLPCQRYQTTARFIPSALHDLRVWPASCTKALNAARIALTDLGISNTGGSLYLSSNISRGQGLGSSTADVTATLRAVAQAHGETLTPESIARLAVMAETAADPMMFDEYPIVFAQREGLLIERFEKALPPMDILGIRDPTNGSGCNTLEMKPPNFNHRELIAFEGLLDQLRDGITTGDLRSVANVATRSALTNQRLLPKPRLESLLKLGRECGALGIQIAHSGTAMGLIFEPGQHQAMMDTRQSLHARYPDMQTYTLNADELICSKSETSHMAQPQASHSCPHPNLFRSIPVQFRV